MVFGVMIGAIKESFFRNRRVTREGEGGGLPCLFLKIGKKCPNLEKKCPDCGHLYVKFVIQNEVFKSFQALKRGNFYLAGLFFLVLQVNVYRSAQIPRKLPCPKKILVTCQRNVRFQKKA